MRLADDGEAADLALAVDDLLVREHRAELGAPVDRHLGDVGQARARTASGRSTGSSGSTRDRWCRPRGPSRTRSRALHLLAEVVDVLPGGDRRVDPGLDRVLLGGQAERVPAGGVQHVEAAHALVAARRCRSPCSPRGGRRAARRPTGTGTCRGSSTWGVTCPRWRGRSCARPSTAASAARLRRTGSACSWTSAAWRGGWTPYDSGSRGCRHFGEPYFQQAVPEWSIDTRDSTAHYIRTIVRLTYDAIAHWLRGGNDASPNNNEILTRVGRARPWAT